VLAEFNEADLLLQTERPELLSDRVVVQPILQSLRQHHASVFTVAHIQRRFSLEAQTTFTAAVRFYFKAIKLL
jgi:hypothetical protein